MLYLIGMGLHDEKDITLNGIEAIKSSDFIYFESYTGYGDYFNIKKLEQLTKKKIKIVERDFVEQQNEIINNSKKKNVALLIIGDPLSATTHIELILEAKKQKIEYKIIHNASIFTAVAETGLQIYKFGKTTSIPYPEKNFKPESAYDVLKENKKAGAHTLILLDVKPPKFMTINEAINILLEIENKKKEKIFTPDTVCIGCARLGGDSIIRAGAASLISKADFGKPPHCLVVPGKLHFLEEAALSSWK